MLSRLYSYTEDLLAAYTSKEEHHYDKSNWEYIYIVNTDGNVYSYSDLYNSNFSHGNIFTQPFEELVRSVGHQRAIKAAESRMASICPRCRHYGRACDGYPVAEESPGYGQLGADGGAKCVKDRGILDYIERRLQESGFIDPLTGIVKLPTNYKPHFVAAIATPG